LFVQGKQGLDNGRADFGRVARNSKQSPSLVQGVFPQPIKDGLNLTLCSGLTGGAGYGVFAAAKFPQETALWAKYLTSTEPMASWGTQTGYMPTRKTSIDLWTKSSSPIIKDLANMATATAGKCEVGNFWPIGHLLGREAFRMMEPVPTQVATGQKTEEQALNDITKDVNAMLEQRLPKDWVWEKFGNVQLPTC
jgi:hypothetical protein